MVSPIERAWIVFSEVYLTELFIWLMSLSLVALIYNTITGSGLSLLLLWVAQLPVYFICARTAGRITAFNNGEIGHKSLTKGNSGYQVVALVLVAKLLSDVFLLLQAGYAVSGSLHYEMNRWILGWYFLIVLYAQLMFIHNNFEYLDMKRKSLIQ